MKMKVLILKFDFCGLNLVFKFGFWTWLLQPKRESSVVYSKNSIRHKNLSICKKAEK